MNQLYEVYVIAYSMKTFHVSAETASVSGNEYYEGYIKNNDDCKGIPDEEMCKNCILHSIYNSVGDVSIDKG